MSLYTGLTQLSNDSPQKHFTRRTLLPVKKNAVWQIESGFVITYTYLEDGTTVALGLWGPGDVVGEVLSKMKPYRMECLTKVEATVLPVDDCPDFSQRTKKKGSKPAKMYM